MKLWCRKCDKEIRGYTLYPEWGGIDDLFSFKIRVSCHSDVDEKVINVILKKEFNPADYGDLYFFEKDEKKLKVSKLTWTEDKPTEPGWYWRKNVGSIWTEYVDSIPTMFGTSYSLYGVNYFDKSKKFDLDDCAGEWAGPIPKPVDVSPGRWVEVSKDCCLKWRMKPLGYTVDGCYLELLPIFCPECGKKL